MIHRPTTTLFSAAVLALLLPLAVPTPARAQVEAASGRPFGVGRVTLNVPPGEATTPSEDDRFFITERQQRVLYPAMETAPVRRVLRRLLEIEAPRRITIYFLFQGDAPLDLEVYAPNLQRIGVQPVPDPGLHNRLLQQWWREYNRPPSRLFRSEDYPPLVENYLAATLARRLNLAPPREVGRLLGGNGELEQAVGLMLGTESIRAAMQRDTLLDTSPEVQAATEPLPEPVAPPAVELPPSPEDVQIETIAHYVPHECFYVRFGTFTNYLWLRDFLDQWGGDLQNMVALRGIDYGLNQSIEQRLSLRESVLSEVLGPTVISDVAIIGDDTFVREGASLGVLFQARNNFLLSSNFNSLRQETLDSVEGATQETVQIAGQEVSFLSTPDGSVRSYYAVADNFHLIATSESLIRRFLQASQDNGSLGGSAEFRYARSVMPLERDDSVFVYLSDAFFRQMVSPHYRVEMTRRMQAAVDIELVQLARLAAQAEGSRAHSIGELIQAGYLPPGLTQRPDGSRPVEVDGELVDSRRGEIGSFVPISDIEVEALTPAEVEAYYEFARFYRSQWERMDPVMLGIGRQDLGEGLERLTMDVYITPYARSRYGFLATMLGPPTTTRLREIPGDLVSLQLVMQANGILGGGVGEVYHIFGGIRDHVAPYVVEQGQIAPRTRLLDWARGYLGAWPRPGILSFLLGDRVRPDPQGYAPLANNWGWQRQTGEFVVLSLSRDVIPEIVPHLGMEEAERPAQLRMQVAELGSSQYSRLINAFAYMRARQASVSGTKLMNALTQQLHVPPEEARQVTEQLLGGRLVCALGGDYQLIEELGGRQLWTSTALSPENRYQLMDVPPDYTFPLLTWFRGLDAELSLTDTTLSGHAVLDIQRPSGERPVGALPAPPDAQ